MKHEKALFNVRNTARKLKLFNQLTTKEYFELFEVCLDNLINNKEQIAQIGGTVKELND